MQGVEVKRKNRAVSEVWYSRCHAEYVQVQQRQLSLAAIRVALPGVQRRATRIMVLTMSCFHPGHLDCHCRTRPAQDGLWSANLFAQRGAFNLRFALQSGVR